MYSIDFKSGTNEETHLREKPPVMFTWWECLQGIFSKTVSFDCNIYKGTCPRISSNGDDQRIFLGLKFSIPGFFWVGKFGKYCFGWLDLSSDFFGYSKQSGDSW